VQAALELLAEHEVDPKEIESITALVTAQQMIVCEPADLKRRPRTSIAAKFSLYYTLATTLSDRHLDFASFSDAALIRADVLTLVDKVSYRIEPKHGNDVLELTLRNGTVYRRSVYAVSGSPQAPLSNETLSTKFVDCGGHALRPRSTSQLRRAADSMLSLEQIPNVRTLFALL
jgi:2-methylcitrate dehydratase PrpD